MMANDSSFSFFFKNKKSVIETFKFIGEFSCFSGVEPNKEKCEVVQTGVKVALFGKTNIDLKESTVKILGVYYSYNKKLERFFFNSLRTGVHWRIVHD